MANVNEDSVEVDEAEFDRVVRGIEEDRVRNRSRKRNFLLTFIFVGFVVLGGVLIAVYLPDNNGGNDKSALVDDGTPSPTPSPSAQPTASPSATPTAYPTMQPSSAPSQRPTFFGETYPPTAAPSVKPSGKPSATPSLAPSSLPSSGPTGVPSATPSVAPSPMPSGSPSKMPTMSPSSSPSSKPSTTPTAAPTSTPSVDPTLGPTATPSAAPSSTPSVAPTFFPTRSPSATPSKAPTKTPTATPSKAPTLSPSGTPSKAPTKAPTKSPTISPSGTPSKAPTKAPTASPSKTPTIAPTTPYPTRAPINFPPQPVGTLCAFATDPCGDRSDNLYTDWTEVFCAATPDSVSCTLTACADINFLYTDIYFFGGTRRLSLTSSIAILYDEGSETSGIRGDLTRVDNTVIVTVEVPDFINAGDEMWVQSTAFDGSVADRMPNGNTEFEVCPSD